LVQLFHIVIGCNTALVVQQGKRFLFRIGRTECTIPDHKLAMHLLSQDRAIWNKPASIPVQAFLKSQDDLIRCSQSAHQIFVSVNGGILPCLSTLCISITALEALDSRIPIGIAKISDAISCRILII